MEPLHPQHLATPESPAAAADSTRAPRGSNRCHRRTLQGRCRLPVHDPATGLCFRHARVRKTTYSGPERADLSADLFGPTPPSFDSPEEINHTLANLVVLVAQGRISTRRASVITYALSFILRGLQVIDKQALDSPEQYIMDIPCAVARHALAAQMQTPAPNSEIVSVANSDSISNSSPNPSTNSHAAPATHSTSAPNSASTSNFAPAPNPTAAIRAPQPVAPPSLGPPYDFYARKT